MRKKIFLALAVTLGLVVDFAVLAKAAHDVWAATVVYLAVLLMLIVLLAAEAWDTESDGLQIKPTLMAVPLVVAFCASYVQAVNPSESFSELLDWIFAVLLFFLAQQLFREKKNIGVFLLALCPLFPIEFFLHLQQKYLWGWSTGVAGSLLNSNVSAVFNLFWVPLIILSFRLFSFEDKATKRLFAISSFFVFGTLALVQSTSALLCIILFLPVIIGWPFLDEFRQKNKVLFYVLAVLAGAVFCAFLGIKIAEIMTGHVWGTSLSYTSRLVWWKSGWRMFTQHPWLGIGLGNFPSAYLAYKGAGINTLFPHNILVGWLSETGLLGFISVGSFFIAWLKQTSAIFDFEEARPFKLGALMVLVFCCFNVGLEYFVILLLTLIFMGIAVAGSDEHRWKPRKSVGILLIAFCLFSIPYVLAPFLASQNVVVGMETMKGFPGSDEALKYFSRAVELDGRSYMGYLGLAKTQGYRAIHQKDQDALSWAVTYQRAAVERNKLSGLLWWELGVYYEMAHDIPNAKDAFEKATAYDRSNATFLKNKQRLETFSASSS